MSLLAFAAERRAAAVPGGRRYILPTGWRRGVVVSGVRQ